MESFVSARARSHYILFCIATFLAFLTMSTLAYLAVVLHSLNYSTEKIGFVLSSPFVPTIIGTLVVGRLMQNFRAIKIAITGLLICSCCFLAMQAGVEQPYLLTFLRGTLGLGFGLFFSSAMLFTRSLLQGPNVPYYFGIYASMLPLPNIIGPTIMELYYDKIGIEGLFLTLGIPLLLGLLLLVWIARHDDPAAAMETHSDSQTSYLDVFKKKSNYLPMSGVIVVGFLWGFIASFLALYLSKNHIPMIYYFMPATGALFLSRLFLVKHIIRYPIATGVGFGFACMTLGNLFLFFPSSLSVILAGGIFGLGYSFAFPLLSTWFSDQYPIHERAKPTAIFNACFQFGICLIPLISGYIIANFSTTTVLIGLVGVAAVFTGLMFLNRSAGKLGVE